MIDVDYNEYKKTIAENMKLIVENNRLKEVEKEHQKLNGELREENERLNNIINELEKDFERKIQCCTIEAETTTNDFYCRLHITTLKRWLNKIQELKGSDK